MNAAQRLIQAAHPRVKGLQVALGHTLAFNIIQEEFVQVLHTGAGHWVAVSTTGCGPDEVGVFDSMSFYLSGALERQIAALLCTKHDVITVRYVDVRLLTQYTITFITLADSDSLRDRMGQLTVTYLHTYSTSNL